MLSTLPLFYIAQSVDSDDRRARFQGLRVIMSFVAGQGTLVPCVFMCSSTNFQTSSCGFFVCFCLFSFDEIAFLVF